MKDSVKISVIIPIYNVEKYIEECLSTVINQTLKDIEIICVDDCTKDDSMKIVERYAKKDKRIRILKHSENSGLSCARNTGIKNANGKYIYFIDSDDYIDENMLEKMYDKAVKTDSDIVISNINLFFEDTGLTQVFRDSLFYGFLAGRTFAAHEYPKIITSIAAWDKIYKKSLLIENELYFPPQMIYEDHIFTVQALISAKRISVINEPYYFYRKNTGNSITDNEKYNNKYKFDYLEVSRRAKAFMKEKGVYDCFQDEYLKYQFTQAGFHQQFSTDYENFKLFFEQVKAMTTQSDIECLRKMDLNYFTELYLGFIEAGSVAKAYSVMTAKSHFCRNDGYLCYCTKKGKMFKIMKLR